MNSWFQQKSRVELEEQFAQIFNHYLWFCLYGLIGFGFQRLLLKIFLLNSGFKASQFEFLELFWMGARFDLVVFGFFGIPLVLIGLLTTLGGIFFVYYRPWAKVYLIMLTGVSALVGLFDFSFFVFEHRRACWSDYGIWLKGLDLKFIESKYGLDLSSNFWLAFLGLFVFWLIILRAVWKIERTTPRGILARFHQPSSRLLRYLLPPLIVGFFARGTLTPHHLELQHSQLTSSRTLNDLALNPIWTLDKTPTQSKPK